MLALSANVAQAKDFDAQKYITHAKDATAFVSKRPAESERLFRSDAVEKKIKEVKKLLKDKEISEDEARGSDNDIQKLTDKFIAEVDTVTEEKEKEIMTV